MNKIIIIPPNILDYVILILSISSSIIYNGDKIHNFW